MRLIVIGLICLSVAGLAGCGQEFAAGMATGVVAAQKLADDAQERFVESVNNLNVETAKINTKIEAVEDIDVKSFIKQETIAAVNSLKGREKDPVAWIALASILANAFVGGRAIEKKRGQN